MLSEEYSLCYAEMQDIESWVNMITIIRDNFPGLETDEELDSYKHTVIKNIKRKTALCVKFEGEVVGAMLFSYNSKCISCMAVHPNFRKRGIASAMVEKMLSLFPKNIDISVTTFRDDDIKGNGPRQLYKKYGFEEDDLIVEFDYPHQKFILHRE